MVAQNIEASLRRINGLAAAMRALIDAEEEEPGPLSHLASELKDELHQLEDQLQRAEEPAGND